MAATRPLRLTVITPERQVLEEHAESVVIPAHDGELGVLEDRAPLMCELGIGQLRYTQSGTTSRVFIDGGFAQVLQNQVTVLTPNALPRAAITADVVATAERELQQLRGAAPDQPDTRQAAQQRAAALRRLLAE